jgi:DNA-directed RNA polymerase subunit E'/Rpb7
MEIHPSNFGILSDEVLISEINKEYSNRVLHDVGLSFASSTYPKQKKPSELWRWLFVVYGA